MSLAESLWRLVCGTFFKELPPGVGTKFLDGLGRYDDISPATDLKSSVMTDGQLIIGNTGDPPTIAALAAGTGITITNGAGSIEIKASGVDAGCDVYHDTTQSVADNDATVALVFNTETRDTDAFHSTAANTGRITIPAGMGGWYLLGAHVPWTASSTGDRKIWFRTNGSTASTPVTWDLALGGFQHEIVQPIYLAAGDYVEVMAYQNSGGALNVLANARFWALKMGGLPIAVMGQIQNCRLTLTTASPFPTADQTAKTTVYLTPTGGNSVTLMDSSGNIQTPVALAEISVAVPATTSTPFDVWLYSNGGVLTLETASWTNDTTRATALAVTKGITHKSGDTTRLYVGTGRTTTVSGETEDSTTSRLLWNKFNRRRRFLKCLDTTNSWTYTTGAFREVNGGSTLGTSRVAVVIGEIEDAIEAIAYGMASNATAITAAAGIGIDSSTVNSALWYQGGASSTTIPNIAKYEGYPAVGYHTFRHLEYSQAAGATTWYGDLGVTYWQSGMTVAVWM